ncbi:hypothetical protein ACPW96_16880 [Micromonospora sp. DT81.3]|uniref:hypothetical protein n=1 Tax=Actinomycetes TaxID=1760 RepID=UPI003CEACEA3
MSTRSATSLLLLLATSLLLLAGAAIVLVGGVGGSGFALLDRDAESADALPADLAGDAYDSVDTASARWVAEHDGDQLYLARGTEVGTVCLLVHREDWVVGCGGPQLGVSNATRTYYVQPDADPDPVTGTKVTENVFVKG